MTRRVPNGVELPSSRPRDNTLLSLRDSWDERWPSTLMSSETASRNRSTRLDRGPFSHGSCGGHQLVAPPNQL